MTKEYLIFTEHGKIGILASGFEIEKDSGRLRLYAIQSGKSMAKPLSHAKQTVAVFNAGCWNVVMEHNKAELTESK